MYNYGNREKQEELRTAIRTKEYTTHYEEENSFVDLLDKDVMVETEDVMPSSTTLGYKGEYENYLQNKNVEKAKSVATKERYTISAKGKALIAVYAFILISIFAFIIFNATLLRNLDKKLDRSKTDVAIKQEEVIELKANLEEISSNENVIKEAIERLNMYYAEG